MQLRCGTIEQEAVFEIKCHRQYVSVACAHPELPIIVTGSSKGDICISNAINCRVEKKLKVKLGTVLSISCRKDSKRIMVACEKGVFGVEVTRLEDHSDTDLQPNHAIQEADRS